MFCPNCGKAIESGSAFCGECGASIAQDSAAVPTEHKKSKMKLWIAMLVGIVLLIGIVWYATLPGASSPEEAVIRYVEARGFGDLEEMDKYRFYREELRYEATYEKRVKEYGKKGARLYFEGLGYENVNSAEDYWNQECERRREADSNVMEVSCKILEVIERDRLDMLTDKSRLLSPELFPYTEFTSEDLEETAWVIFEVTRTARNVQTGEPVTTTQKQGYIVAKLDGRWYFLYDKGYY